MVDELEQFQKDLLDSVRQMKSKASRVTEKSLSEKAEGRGKTSGLQSASAQFSPVVLGRK